MNAIDIRKCKKCGMHFINTKKSKLPAENTHCYECRGDKHFGTAILFAKVIEKMMRE